MCARFPVSLLKKISCKASDASSVSTSSAALTPVQSKAADVCGKQQGGVLWPTLAKYLAKKLPTLSIYALKEAGMCSEIHQLSGEWEHQSRGRGLISTPITHSQLALFLQLVVKSYNSVEVMKLHADNQKLDYGWIRHFTSQIFNCYLTSYAFSLLHGFAEKGLEKP